MTTQELFTELRRHGFVPAPKLGTTGIWSLKPKGNILTDPDKAKVEVILLGESLSIGAPGRPGPKYLLTTPAALASDLLRHGAHAPRNETLPPDFFAVPAKAAPPARAKAAPGQVEPAAAPAAA